MLIRTVTCVFYHMTVKSFKTAPSKADNLSDYKELLNGYSTVN